MSSSVIAGLSFETVLYEKKTGIAYITLNRPKVLNALNKRAIADLRAAFEDGRDDSEVHGVILTGGMIGAQEAYRIGLVNEVVSGAELIGRAETILKQIAANAPLSVRYALQAVNNGVESSLSEGLLLEASLVAICTSTEDKKEGTSAFLEKRPAKFQGR